MRSSSFPPRARRSSALVLLATLLLLAGVPTRAAAEEVHPVDGTISIIGHGWGHLRGLSQYGARQAAAEGASAAQILDFYYPGTGSGSAEGQIKVRLDGATAPAIGFVGSSGMQLLDTADGGVRANLQPGTHYELRVDTNKVQRLFRLADGQWVPEGQPIQVESWVQAAAPFVVKKGFGGADGPVRGAMHFASRAAGGGYTMWPVNYVNLDDYTAGVVTREMPSSWGAAALQAQAVAARTYAVSSRRSAGTNAVYDICNTTQCQVYGGVNGESANGVAAVQATSGQIRTWEGQPAFTQYSSSNGGWTRAGSVPYQVVREDGWDKRSANPYANWEVKLTTEQLTQAYPNIGTVQRIVVTSRDGYGDWGGRVLQLRLEGTGGSLNVSGDAFRSKFGMRSTYYTPIALCGDGRFRDVPSSSQFCSDIIWMSDTGLANGYPDGTYRPATPVSRQAMAAFLWRAEGEPAAQSSDPHFADVDASNPFFTAVQWMHEAGLSTGTPQSSGKPTYEPLGPISRQAMAAFFWRWEQQPGAGSDPHFADVDGSNAFYAAIQWMFESGLSTGTAQPSGRPLFKPVDAVSRQAMAAFVHRFEATKAPAS